MQKAWESVLFVRSACWGLRIAHLRRTSKLQKPHAEDTDISIADTLVPAVDMMYISTRHLLSAAFLTKIWKLRSFGMSRKSVSKRISKMYADRRVLSVNGFPLGWSAVVKLKTNFQTSNILMKIEHKKDRQKSAGLYIYVWVVNGLISRWFQPCGRWDRAPC